MLTERQIKERRNGIGGTDAAAILGLSPWKSRLDVYLEKVEGKDDFQVSKQAEYGLAVEPALLKLFEREHKKTVIPYKQTIRRKDKKFILAHLDGYIKEENAVLEIKTAYRSYQQEWGKALTDEMPTHYLIQCAHYAMVTGADKVLIFVSLDGQFPKLYIYNKDEELQKILLEKEEQFWNEHVLKKIPPEPLSIKEVESLYKGLKEQVKIATPEEIELYSRLKGIKAKITELEETQKSIKTQICQSLKDYTILMGPNNKPIITWKAVHKKQFSSTALQKEMPEVYEQYIKPMSYRMFLTK